MVITSFFAKAITVNVINLLLMLCYRIMKKLFKTSSKQSILLRNNCLTSIIVVIVIIIIVSEYFFPSHSNFVRWAAATWPGHRCSDWSTQPFCHSTLSRQTDRHTERPTDGLGDRSVRIARTLAIDRERRAKNTITQNNKKPSWTLGVADRTAPSHTSTITRYVFERSTRSVDKRSSYLRK